MYLRLDGQTAVQKRQQIVELFNSHYSKHCKSLSVYTHTGIVHVGFHDNFTTLVSKNISMLMEFVTQIWIECSSAILSSCAEGGRLQSSRLFMCLAMAKLL